MRYASTWPKIKNGILLNMKNAWAQIGLVAAVMMPLWNIPLIWRIIQRRTSCDISLSWLFGVWGCILLMLPSALSSQEIQLKAFGISNAFFFSWVVVAVLMYRKNGKNENKTEGALPHDRPHNS